MATRKPPPFRVWQVSHRIAARLEPKIAKAFLAAMARLIAAIDERALDSALRSGEIAMVDAAVPVETQLDLFDLEREINVAVATSGMTNADILAEYGLAAAFAASHPDVVLYARRSGATLVAAVSEDIREAIRLTVALGAEHGLTVAEQARVIREAVGLRPQWTNALVNLGRELREGTFDDQRRLSAADKAMIRSRIARDTVDEAFIGQMQAKYAASLRNRRALDIARTETLTAVHHGQHEAWRQAVDQGVLPSTSRRFVVVTPDDRLRETHAAVPGMNPDGRGLDEPFETPMGRFLYPPFEPNCRCSVGLVLVPGQPGRL